MNCVTRASLRFVVLVTVFACGLHLGCSGDRSNNHYETKRLAFIGTEGPDFLGVIKFDATTWEVMDSTSSFEGVRLIGTNADGSGLFASSGYKMYRIDVATMDVTDSLATEFPVAEFVLIPEDDVILRSSDESLDVIDLTTLTIRDSHQNTWRALSWNAVTRQAVGCLQHRGVDSTMVVFDYEADTLIREIILRGTDGVARFVYNVLLDHSRNRLLAIGWRGRGWFMAIDLETDSCLFQASMSSSLGDIELSRDFDACYVTNPGDIYAPGGSLSMFNAEDYDLLDVFNGYDQSMPPTEWLVPGELILPSTGGALVVVPSRSYSEGPLAILNAETLAYLKSIRVWETPLQLVYSAAINF